MIKFVGPLSFLPFADCGNRMSTIMTRSVMTASTNSGAIRPQSAAVTEYVNVMENTSGPGTHKGCPSGPGTHKGCPSGPGTHKGCHYISVDLDGSPPDFLAHKGCP